MGEVKKDCISLLKIANISLVYPIFFGYTPSFWFCIKKDFGLAPGFPKKIGLPVVIQELGTFPMTIGEKNGGIIYILIKFQQSTTFKTQYFLLGFSKNPLKTSNIFLFESQFYDTYQHLEKINGYGIPIVQPQEGRGSTYRT